MAYMAMQLYCVLFLLLISVIANSCCAFPKMYDIYPEATCRNCSSDTKCLTLSDIVNESEKYFTSNSTLVFHDGNHILQGELISVSNISNFTLQGYSSSGSGLSSPTIMCDPNPCNITLWDYFEYNYEHDYEYEYSGGSFPPTACFNSSFSFSDASITVASINFNYCSISLWQSTVAVQDSRFENGRALDGGALAVYYSSVQFDGANGFVGNAAAEYGGAIYADWSNLAFSGSTLYKDNKAYYGGAVYCEEGTSLGFEEVSTFTNNKALSQGGAVYTWFSNRLSFSGNNSFVGNSASDGGATCASNNNTLRFNGNSSFMKNTAYNGGAVMASDSNTLSFNGENTFTSNTAMYGGAVYVDNNNTLSLRGNSEFVRNTVEIGGGGAVFAGYDNTLSFSGKNNFASNSATEWSDGGAIYAETNNTLIFSGTSSFMNHTELKSGSAVYACDGNTLSFSGNSWFVNNMAVRDGGAVYAKRFNTLSFIGNTRFVNNTAVDNGGAVYALKSNSLNFSGNNRFTSNAAWSGNGGAVDVEHLNSLSFNGNSSFMNNEWPHGGAIYFGTTTALSCSGNSSFRSNKADVGGAVCANISNSLSFSGNSRFMSNSANVGGAVYVWDGNTLSISEDSSFVNNSAMWYGGAVATLFISEPFAPWPNNISFGGNSRFMGNTAQSGGAVFSTLDFSMSFNGNSSFEDNVAEFGGAVYAVDSKVSFSGNSSFTNNTAEYGVGGAVYAGRGSQMIFSGKSVFEGNVAVRGGGIALVLNDAAHLSGIVLLSSNIARLGGGAFVQDSTFESHGNITITLNEAMHGGGLFAQSATITLERGGGFLQNLAANTETEGGYGGAIFARSSIVRLQGSFNVSNNTADFGGEFALFSIYGGVLLLKQDTKLFFKGNQARRRGGAIFVEDDAFTFCAFDNAESIQVVEPCFFQLDDERKGPYNCLLAPDVHKIEVINVTLDFDNNVANESGNIVYGGYLPSCVVCTTTATEYYGSGTEVFNKISESGGFSNMSSDPYKVCICENNVPNCDIRAVNIAAYPGQVLVTSVVAVGQMNGTVPSVIRAVSNDLITTSDFKETQPAEECSQLQYPLLSKLSQARLELYSDEPCSISGYPFTFQIDFLPCPVGFTLSEQGTCICDERLQKYTNNCSIQTFTISRLQGDSFWVGVEGSKKLILHPHCPFDYCIEELMDVPLDSTANYNGTDMQCANGRSGILCGACQPGHSLALGSSKCLSDCSNHFLALLIVFVFAGVVLVAFLFLCRLTVAEGTLSGLIFYANVLAVNQTVFFPSGEQNLLTVFIAWLNLDLGIETCFFESLDTYYSTWLQFTFPIYIWVIVGTIIVLADRSVLVAKIIGSANPVAVLATLFLLSYTKLLRAIMAVFSFTTLDYSDGDRKYVWLYDGNIGYLDRHDGRHIGLFLFGLLFLLFVFLPYTLLLLCGQWIQRKLWWLPSTWQLYIKSFLDAYNGPYRDRHRYWTGLLLLLRFFMLLVATIMNISNPQDPFSNLLVIQVVSTGVVASYWVIRGLYKKWYLDLMETSFHFNLTILAGGTYQVRQSGGNQAALVYTSVGVVFVTFIGIVISAVMKRVMEKVAQHQHRAIYHHHPITNTEPDDGRDEVSDTVSTSTVTYSELGIIRSDPDQMSGELVLRPVSSDSIEDSNQ